MHGEGELSTELTGMCYICSADSSRVYVAGLILPVSSTPLVEYLNTTDTPNFLQVPKLFKES